MSETLVPVPQRYRGVWVRTLLQTPAVRDETTFVRWVQTSSWHADLRVPRLARAEPASDGAAQYSAAAGQRLALQQGFCGRTVVEQRDSAETCAWHRQHDYQPPGPHPDIGRIAFDGPDRMTETGVHDEYLEVWERLPGSSGRFAVFEQMAESGVDGSRPAILLIAGRFAAWVRPRSAAWPTGTSTADTLGDVIRRHPSMQESLLDFEISFGSLVRGQWLIERSTLPKFENTGRAFSIRRSTAAIASIRFGRDETPWRIVEWNSNDEVLE
jgi:hypothetical protein